MKRKKLQEAREKGLISPSSDWTLDSDGEPARRSDLVKYVYEYGVVTLSFFFFFYKLDNVQLVFFSVIMILFLKFKIFLCYVK